MIGFTILLFSYFATVVYIMVEYEFGQRMAFMGVIELGVALLVFIFVFIRDKIRNRRY